MNTESTLETSKANSDLIQGAITLLISTNELLKKECDHIAANSQQSWSTQLPTSHLQSFHVQASKCKPMSDNAPKPHYYTNRPCTIGLKRLKNYIAFSFKDLERPTIFLPNGVGCCLKFSTQHVSIFSEEIAQIFLLLFLHLFLILYFFESTAASEQLKKRSKRNRCSAFQCHFVPS